MTAHLRLACFTACLFATSFGLAAGEIVMVKYRGPVDVAGFECQASPQSSLVWRTCYDAPHQYLVVNLQGTYYHYCRIPVASVRAWRSADSLGRYFNANIKRNFGCRTGGIPESLHGTASSMTPRTASRFISLHLPFLRATQCDT